jgi:hypothetical protein
MPRRLPGSARCLGLLIALMLFAPAQAVSAPAAVSRYAPWVRFHSGEKHWPDDPDAFIARSALTWVNAGGSCSPVPMNARSVPIVPRGSIDPARLGTGGYAFDACFRRRGVTEETRLTSTDLTAPSTSDRAHRPQGVKSGFTLDLDNSARHGIRPTGSTTAYAPDDAPPTYYEYQARKYIVYWFFFNYNNRVGGRHEGDWEHVTIRLDATDHAVGIAYYAHSCKAREYTWSTMEERGWLREGEHPQAYIAIGGHGAWPEDKDHPFPCGTGGLLDRTSKGRIWRTWATGPGLTNARSRAWYGYGGGWGGGTTGPLGASRHKLGGSMPSGWR